LVAIAVVPDSGPLPIQESHVRVVDKATALRFIEEANRDK
jgi:hypothetical protein